MGDISLLKAIFGHTPYWGSAFGAESGAEHDPQLAFLAAQLPEANPEIRILEIGSWLGRTLFGLCTGLKGKKADWRINGLEDFHAPVAAVSGSGGISRVMTRFFQHAADEGVLEKLLCHNISCIPDHTRITLEKREYRSALDTLPANGFDLIFINASRSVPHFTEILSQSRKLCKQGGIIAGTGLLLQSNAVHPKGHAHALRFKQALPMLSDENTGRYYYPEVTAALGALCGEIKAPGGFWAFAADDPPRPLDPPPPAGPFRKAAAQTDTFRVVSLSKNQFMAVSKAVPDALLFQERLGERDIPGLIYRAETKQRAIELAGEDERRERMKKGTLLSETEHFYLGKYGEDTYLAQSKMYLPLGPIKIFQETLGETELPPHLIKAKTFNELKRKVAVQEAAHEPERAAPFVDRFRRYKIFAIQGAQFVAVREDLERARPLVNMIGEVELYPYVIIGNTMAVVKTRIEAALKETAARRMEAGAEGGWL